MQRQRDIGDQRRELLRIRQLLIERLLEVHRGLAEVLLQHEVVKVEYLTQLRCETLTLEEVGNPHCAPRGLVLVGRADAAAGGADGVGPFRLFPGAVQRDMRGKNQRTARRDAQALEHRHTGVDEHTALREQRIQAQHHAVADEAADVLAHDPGRDERQHGLLPAAHQRMAGVVPSLETGDGGNALGEQVDDLALALISPLHPDDDYELAHTRL